MAQLPFGDKDGVQELLDLGVAGLGIRQDLANEVHGTLHFEGMSLFVDEIWSAVYLGVCPR